MLLGLARLFSWLAGGSVVLLFIYHVRFLEAALYYRIPTNFQRFLLPKITQTSLSRQSLKLHHFSLLKRLTSSLATLKEQQTESYSVLPRSEPWKETRLYATCTSVDAIRNMLDKKDPKYSDIPTVTLLRCGIHDFGKGRDGDDANPTTEDLFRYLEGQIPWLASEDGLHYEVSGCIALRVRLSHNECVRRNFGKLCRLLHCSIG